MGEVISLCPISKVHISRKTDVVIHIRETKTSGVCVFKLKLGLGNVVNASITSCAE